VTATAQPESKSTSRRALLAGALGGLGALAASAIGRATPVRAGVDGDVVLNMTNASGAATSIVNSTNDSTAFIGSGQAGGSGVKGFSNLLTGTMGYSGDSQALVTARASTGVFGYAQTPGGVGVWGETPGDVGVKGSSTSGIGVYGNSNASDQPASLGLSLGNSSGVQGYSGTSSVPAPKAKTGIFGYANQDSSAKGIWGQSPNGRGVMGSSSTGWAGYFSGRVYTERYHELKEITNPSAPGSNKLRLFARDNGSGKTQLCVRFPTGAVQVIKTEP
jgi:hypothetical protein